MPAWEYKDYLGWTEQGDGNLAFGVFVQSGRLKGEMKTALRRIIERYELPVRLTPEQNLILCDIDPQWRNDIISTLQSAGVRYSIPTLYLLVICLLELLRLRLSGTWS